MQITDDAICNDTNPILESISEQRCHFTKDPLSVTGDHDHHMKQRSGQDDDAESVLNHHHTRGLNQSMENNPQNNQNLHLSRL